MILIEDSTHVIRGEATMVLFKPDMGNTVIGVARSLLLRLPWTHNQNLSLRRLSSVLGQLRDTLVVRQQPDAYEIWKGINQRSKKQKPVRHFNSTIPSSYTQFESI